MARKSDSWVLRIVPNISVGLMLIVGGIWALQGDGDFGCKAIKSIFSGDTAKILALVFGVIELLSGVFFFLRLFVGERLGFFGIVLRMIVLVVWAAAIVLGDFINGNFSDLLAWSYNFAMHLIIFFTLFITRG